MTLCIAAKARLAVGKQALVTCTDSRLETEFTSSDTGIKCQPIGEDWLVLFAGTVMNIQELMGLYNKALRDSSSEVAVMPRTELIEFLRESANEYKRRIVEEFCQSRFAMSFDRLLDVGEKFPPGIYDSTLRAIAKLESRCQLLLCRLRSGLVDIYLVDSNFMVSEIVDFCSIGSGGVNADAWLYFRQQSRRTPLISTLCHVNEAQEFGFRAPGVGETNVLMYIADPSEFHGLAQSDRAYLQKFCGIPQPIENLPDINKFTSKPYQRFKQSASEKSKGQQ